MNISAGKDFKVDHVFSGEITHFKGIEGSKILLLLFY